MAPTLDGCTPWPGAFVDRYWAAGHWRGNTLDNLLRGWALQYGPRTALVHDGERVTYANLNRRVERRAAGFRLRGLHPGQRVLVQLPSVPEAVVTLFALMRAGLVPVLCPLSYGAPEITRLARVTQAVGWAALAEHPEFDTTAAAADIAARWPFLRRVFTLDAPGASSPYGGLTTDPAGCQYSPLGNVDAPPAPALVQGADQVAFLLPAGAVTGEPVLVPRTHDDYAYQARAAAELVSLTEDDVYLAVPAAGSPFVLGGPGVVGTLSVGGTVVLADGPEPGACLALVAREAVTVTSLTADAAGRWLDALPADGDGAGTGSLRLVQAGGDAALSGATAEGLGRALGCRVQRVFGLAEGPLLLSGPGEEDATEPEGRVRPLSPDDDLRVVGADGADVPDGEPGELLARGPYTPRGYYRAPEHDARSYTPGGWLRTGFLARRTPAGALLVTGRHTAPEQEPADDDRATG
ncbi:AMP-binding protein [Streptomyces sp. NPDC101118]|uniref:AMP-binding protein n=1 Tax=Streptomyces sp. NPDC101118 TaxID=3366109 RepID=UPI0038134964